MLAASWLDRPQTPEILVLRSAPAARRNVQPRCHSCSVCLKHVLGLNIITFLQIEISARIQQIWMGQSNVGQELPIPPPIMVKLLKICQY